MVPMATGPRSPRSLMAHMALERKDSARAISELEKLLEHANTDLESVRLLARELEANKSPSGKLMSAYERLAQLDPFDAANHSKLGRLKMQAGDARTAVREFRAAIAAGSLDPAAAHSDLAESYLAVGDKVQARRAVLAAIEVAPGYPRAQELLLKVVGQ
jgi:Flp pilus assembly protein TadD